MLFGKHVISLNNLYILPRGSYLTLSHLSVPLLDQV